VGIWRLPGTRERGIDVLQSVTYVLLHGVQDECLELVQTMVDSRSPPLLHDRLVALHKNNSLSDAVKAFTYNDRYIRR
jgi:hypothetical protein